ncbi:MAG: paraquat-inducible protein A [Campylobacterales bacterium]|nr:paraquat-inducible protein A [Campylobacterales bacterium]
MIKDSELDALIICKKCHKLHKVEQLKHGEIATCSLCNTVLYSCDQDIIKKGLALSIASLIFLFLTNLFPLVQVDFLGSEQYVTITKTIITLSHEGFWFVALMVASLIFVSPIIIISLYITLFMLIYLKRNKDAARKMLILLGYILPWHMSDIFLISILVALVKLIGFVQINMGVAFFSLLVFVIINLYITRAMPMHTLWFQYQKNFKDEKDD